MFHDHPLSKEFKRLRKKAENFILTQPDDDGLIPADSAELVEELRISRAELEMQNEELRRSQGEQENLLRKFVGLYYDAAPCAYLTLSAKGIIKELNFSGVTLLKTQRLNLKQTAFSAFIDTACHMNYFLALKQAAKTGAKQTVELKINVDENDSVWVMANIIPDIRSSGEFRQYRIALLDISYYKKSEICLKQRERYLGIFFDQAPVACHFLDGGGRIIEVNRCFEKMTGHTRQQVLGKEFKALLHPDGVKPFAQALARFQSGTRFSDLPLSVRKQDNTYARVIARVLACPEESKNGQNLCFCFLPESGSRKKNSNKEEAPARTKEFPGNHMQLDLSGRIVFANNGCHTLLGYAPGTLEGRYQWSLASNPKEARSLKRWFEYQITRHLLPENFLVEFKTGEDKIITLQTNWSYHHDDSSRLKGLLLTLTDVSNIQQVPYGFTHAQVQKNEKIFKLQKDLAHTTAAIKILSGKINESRKEVEQTMMATMENLVVPYIERLKNSRLEEGQTELLNQLTTHLRQLTDPFANNMLCVNDQLTPMEIQVAHLIRQGKTNKEIAPLLSISLGTVNFHRENLREKLGIKHKKINLRSALLSDFGGNKEPAQNR